MQKRLKESIWPANRAKPIVVDQASPLEKLNQMRANMPNAGYIRQAGLIPGVLPISSATLWRWIANGQFPRPIKLSPRVTAWRVHDIEVWLQAEGRK